MIKVKVNEIWLDKVNVRDWIYKKALRQKESLSIVIWKANGKKEYMFIPYANLKKAKQYTTDGCKNCKLVYFERKPLLFYVNESEYNGI